MKFGELRDNAMFLACWYERSRPVTLICLGTLIGGILLLMTLSVSNSYHQWQPGELADKMFKTVVGVQALVLLLQGSLFAAQMGARERMSGTLDFHRASPQSVQDKIVGLLVGSTWFEWMVFALLMVFQLPLAAAARMPMENVFFLNISLILTGILFQTTACLISLMSTQKTGRHNLIVVMLLAWWLVPMFMYSVSRSGDSFFSYLAGVTALKFVESGGDLSGSFFQFRLPLIVLQAMAQIPLWFILIQGLRRIFYLPNSPAFSKEHVLIFCGYVMFFVSGIFIAQVNNFDQLVQSSGVYFYPRSLEGFVSQEAWSLVTIFLLLGVLMAAYCVPTYFKRSKLVVQSRQKLITPTWWDDGASGLPVILIYVAVAGLLIAPFLAVLQSDMISKLSLVIYLISYVLGFAGFLEYFRLSKFRGSKAFFITVLLVWFAFVPWLATLMVGHGQHTIFEAISPFFGLYSAIEIGLGEQAVDMNIFAPVLIAALTWMLAYTEHASIEQETK